MVQGIPLEDGCILNKNPATGELISKVPITTNVEDIVQQAQAAFGSWSKSTAAADRINLLKQGLLQLKDEKKADELAQLITKEMGKPLLEAQGEVECAVEKDEYFQILHDSLQPIQHKSSTVIRQALGVVVILSPWNFPADEILLLALPALASGNTVIVKPSEVTPETGRMVVETLAQVLPPHVLQLAQGDGAVGAALVSNDTVKMVCMTGSSATGKKILSTAAPQLKRCVLELGGKDPMIVFDSADLDKAAHDAVAYSLSNSGQVCCSIERIYVAESIYDKFAKLVAEKYAPNFKVGNGMEMENLVGPLVSTTQKDHVSEHVQDATEKGAKVLYESSVPENAPEGSSFFPVTVLSNVEKGMRVYDEETFGPIVSLTSFSGSEKDAVDLANNDSPYGLGSAVYTKDEELADRVAASICAGQVGINCYALDHMDVACPWVGHKESGFGFHSGRQGFENFSLPKTIVKVPK
mmetsp:Transcript_23495/g.55537  ORF Transcript_23495/g.55537 Transcript_23495/m.55537 type:complete len:469 (-) Transcript_23495:578-1984(-)|eukprot:CAMPEP_0168749132 /NCGR_PEP_ID=MMETSP0724-20121128/16548_1 /TAXON_ID=265536 /ORGANISM="Amphiprora sp., Strain CCMP467" /LENGTH=468 /DNA_ID=CAMNT_0008797011 /DNA_START=311 /DNA_END=1717 /DNA_ORIENTATION=-